MYAFAGDVYIGLDAYTLQEDKVERMQSNLRILSGMYGVLNPLDLIQPHRLEMGTQLKINQKKNLYDFWGNTITDALNNELEHEELFINLASQEYFKAIKPKELKVPVITPIFKDLKNGEYKTIMTFAKLARGYMVRYIIDSDIESLEELKGFKSGGYGYDDNLSTETELVFTR